MTVTQRAVLSVAYPFAALGERAVGGAEQVLMTVEAALGTRGFRSIVAAHAASVVAGELRGVAVPQEVLTPEIRAEVEGAMQEQIEQAFRAEPIDLVHMHGIDFHRYTIPGDAPVLVTLHLPPAWYPGPIWDLPANYQLQCVSESQRAACPSRAQRRLVVVENGVPLPSLPQRGPERRRYALILSRICPEKNLHLALDAARTAGIPTILAGQVFPYPEHLRYFDEQIVPRLGRGARFVGAVGGLEKERLLSRARCLLLPTLADETSSLVAMEALASGTPVVALPSGAIPEIVEDGVTGFLVTDRAGMAAAITKAARLSSETCRRIARERFSATTMVDRYLALYEQLLS